MAVTNPYIEKYQLVTPFLDENQYWIATDEPIPFLIDFATITDDELDFLVPKYPDWAEPLVELVILVGTIEFGGSLFTNNEPFAIETQSGVFEPVATALSSNTTPDGDTIVTFDYYLDNLTPPSAAGVLDWIVINGVPGINYIGGDIPDYLLKLSIQGCDLMYMECTSFPQTLTLIDLSDNLLGDTDIDNILIMADESGASSGTIDLTGVLMGTPTGASATAIANLNSKSWAVLTN